MIKKFLLLFLSVFILFTHLLIQVDSSAADDSPAISDKGKRQIIKIPAMPDKGFCWPYFLAIPGKSNKNANRNHKRYLMVDINNTGMNNNYDECLQRTESMLADMGQFSMRVADELGVPILIPVFPRPSVRYFYQDEENIFYTHALDRDTAALHLKMQESTTAATLTKEFAKAGYDVNMFLRLDLQLIAMINHANEYLNKYGQQIETDKVFMIGFSASGSFIDRFTCLHPQRVKAVSCGGTLDEMIFHWRNIKIGN